MSTTRVTQNMLTNRSYAGLQASLARLGAAQEQLTTGKVINRPSDDPTGASTAMRLRSALATQSQYLRNADDAVGWLDQADTALGSMSTQVTYARDLAVQGSSGAASADSRAALAAEIDQIRASLIDAANTSYLGRPIFGGSTAGTTAYTDAGELTDPDLTVNGPGVVRTVASGTKIRVDITGPQVFGDGDQSLFKHLADLSVALRAGDSTAISQGVTDLTSDSTRVVNARSEIGARTNRVESAQSTATDSQLSLKDSLSKVEDTDLAQATVNLQLQEVAYQAALGATSRVIQPSLMDFMK